MESRPTAQVGLRREPGRGAPHRRGRTATLGPREPHGRGAGRPGVRRRGRRGVARDGVPGGRAARRAPPCSRGGGAAHSGRTVAHATVPRQVAAGPLADRLVRASGSRSRRRGGGSSPVRHRTSAQRHHDPLRRPGLRSLTSRARGVGAPAAGATAPARALSGLGPLDVGRHGVAPDGDGRLRPGRHPPLPRADAEGVCLDDVAGLPLRGIHGAVPGSLLRRLPRRRVLAATRIRAAPSGAADPPTTLPAAAVALEVSGPPPRAAHTPGRLPRRPARRDTPGSVDGSAVDDEPDRQPQVGPQ